MVRKMLVRFVLVPALALALFELSASAASARSGGGGAGRCQPLEDEVALMSCGTVPGASGKRRVRIRKDCRQDLRIEVQDVPAGSYTVFVGGVARGTITVGALGQGQIEFDTRPGVGELLLTFDPFGEIDVVQAATGGLVLSLTADAACLGTPPPTCTFSEDLAVLVDCGTIPGASGTRRVRVRDDCGEELRVEIQNVPAGTYGVLIDGVPRGTITTDALGQGQIDFDSAPAAGEVLLDFNPTGDVDVVQAATGALVLSLTADATCPGAAAPPPGGCTPLEDEVALVNCGAIVSASGKSRLRVREDCRTELRVEIQNVPAGGYPLLVDGVLRGTIPVDATGQGQIEFDTQPGLGELVLDFDPTGEVDVTDGSVLVLSLSASCMLP
jgi:hypothetical protein